MKYLGISLGHVCHLDKSFILVKPRKILVVSVHLSCVAMKRLCYGLLAAAARPSWQDWHVLAGAAAVPHNWISTGDNTQPPPILPLSSICLTSAFDIQGQIYVHFRKKVIGAFRCFKLTSHVFISGITSFLTQVCLSVGGSGCLPKRTLDRNVDQELATDAQHSLCL